MVREIPLHIMLHQSTLPITQPINYPPIQPTQLPALSPIDPPTHSLSILIFILDPLQNVYFWKLPDYCGLWTISSYPNIEAPKGSHCHKVPSGTYTPISGPLKVSITLIRGSGGRPRENKNSHLMEQIFSQLTSLNYPWLIASRDLNLERSGLK